MIQNLIQCESPQSSPLDQIQRTPLRKTDPSQFAEFLQDASRMPGGKANAVVFPQTEKQISEYLAFANQARIPVTIAGNHTGLVGGAVPLEGEVLATNFMSEVFPEANKNIVDIISGNDELTSQRYQFYLKSVGDQIHAVVPPGLRLGEFQKRLEAKGLFYPPDPTEWNAFLGATVSTNASGSRTFKYGATRSFAKVLRVVLAQGYVLEIKRNHFFPDAKSNFQILFSKNNQINLKIPSLSIPRVKHAAGYFCQPNMDFIDLWIGSEGTLGIVTQIELALHKKPLTVMGAIVFFPKESGAIHFTEKIRKDSQETWRNNDPSGFDVRSIEYFDSNSLNLLRGNPLGVRIPPESKAAIYFEQESSLKIGQEAFENLIAPLFEPTPPTSTEIQNLKKHPFGRMMLLLKEQSVLDDIELAFPEEEKAQQKLKEFRHALPVKVNEVIGQHKRESGLSILHKIATDTATPDQFLQPMMDLFKTTLDRSGIQYLIFGHIGNNHLHANLLPKNEKELALARQTYLELCKNVVAMGGTVSAEHGIGKLKHSSLEILYRKEGLQEMAHLKKALDPHTILGRGNIFPSELL
jgi:D-lactate dehydrogenase (cytochrome)